MHYRVIPVCCGKDMLQLTSTEAEIKTRGNFLHKSEIWKGSRNLFRGKGFLYDKMHSSYEVAPDPCCWTLCPTFVTSVNIFVPHPYYVEMHRSEWFFTHPVTGTRNIFYCTVYSPFTKPGLGLFSYYRGGSHKESKSIVLPRDCAKIVKPWACLWISFPKS